MTRRLADRLREYSDREFGSGATREEIASAEQSLGVRLPNSYRAFLKKFGWGE
jgi:cell wall assembly regulator SMI1